MEKEVHKDTNNEAYGEVITLGQPQNLTVASASSIQEVEQLRTANMGIIRREKSENYSVIYNECFQNPLLSARAKGIFAYLMTLPDDWKIYKQELGKHFKEGRDALNSAFDELEIAGYITKTPERGAKGRLDGWDYTVYESTELLETRNTVNPSDGESATTKYLSLPSTKNTNGVAKSPEDKNRESGNQSKKELDQVLQGSDVTRRPILDEWLAYKRERKQGYKPLGLSKLIKKWERFSPDVLQQAVDSAMESGWSGCFPEQVGQAYNKPAQVIDLSEELS